MDWVQKRVLFWMPQGLSASVPPLSPKCGHLSGGEFIGASFISFPGRTVENGWMDENGYHVALFSSFASADEGISNQNLQLHHSSLADAFTQSTNTTPNHGREHMQSYLVPYANLGPCFSSHSSIPVHSISLWISSTTITLIGRNSQ